MGCIVNGPGESKHADIGISLPGTGEQPAAPVFIDGKKVGSMNAMAYSPRLDKNICYTILDIEHAKSGQEIIIAAPEKDLMATTVDLPWRERA